MSASTVLDTCGLTSHFQLELETTMRQECEAKLTLTSTNYETKIASLEKELADLRVGTRFCFL